MTRGELVADAGGRVQGLVQLDAALDVQAVDLEVVRRDEQEAAVEAPSNQHLRAVDLVGVDDGVASGDLHRLAADDEGRHVVAGDASLAEARGVVVGDLGVRSEEGEEKGGVHFQASCCAGCM